MRADAHIHHISAAYRAELERRSLLTYALPHADAGRVDAFLQRFEIGCAVLAPSPPGVWFGDPGLARHLARMLNEESAALVARDPARRAALAILPLPDLDAAIEEARFALDDLALDGVILLTNVDGVYVGDPAWDPLWEALDARSAYVFVHPTLPPQGASPAFPPWLFDFPFDTTRAAATMLFCGFAQRFARLRVQLAHLGGTVPFLAHRLASLGDRDEAHAAYPPDHVLGDLRWFFYDTGLSNHLRPLEATLAHVPFEHIVFGSDWPYAALPTGVDFAPELDGLGPQGRAALESAHIAALVPRFGGETP